MMDSHVRLLDGVDSVLQCYMSRNSERSAVKEASGLLHVSHKVERQAAENCWKCRCLDVGVEDWSCLFVSWESAAEKARQANEWKGIRQPWEGGMNLSYHGRCVFQEGMCELDRLKARRVGRQWRHAQNNIHILLSLLS